tara:strand:- start:979 stop:1254 length:276 start_codon:yes stop_codon:yes gene_type:complete
MAKIQPVGLSGLGKRIFGGKSFTRVSSHSRKIPHPSKKEAKKLSSRGLLTASQKQTKLKNRGWNTKIVKEKSWYNDQTYVPVWSIYSEDRK